MQSKQSTQRLPSTKWFSMSMQEALQRLPQRLQATHLLSSMVRRKREKRLKTLSRVPTGQMVLQ